MKTMSQRQVIADYVKSIESALLEAKNTILSLESQIAAQTYNQDKTIRLWDYSPLELKVAIDFCKANNFDPRGKR